MTDVEACSADISRVFSSGLSSVHFQQLDMVRDIYVADKGKAWNRNELKICCFTRNPGNCHIFA